MIDVEGGHRFLPIRPVYWDPVTQAPPELADTWDTCVVQTSQYGQIKKAYEWLQSGKHPFKSVIVDSISELQVKAIENIAGREQLKMQDWGSLLRETTGLMRDMRDLTMHPTNPLQCVVLTAMTKLEGEVNRPYLQGQSKVTAPYLFDITGYLTVETFQNPDPTQPKYHLRRLHIVPTEQYVAGERVGGRLGTVVEQDQLSIMTMIDTIYGPDPARAETEGKKK
jgi:hypothetical protein